MISYSRRQDLIQLGRKIPSNMRDVAVDAINPLRVEYVKRRKILRWVTLFITNYCNARCSHCFYWNELNSKKPEMDLAQLETTLSSLEHQLNTVRVSGGEPFLRKDLGDFFALVDEGRLSAKFSVPTHGMLKDLVPRVTAMAENRKYTHLNISVSLDGLEERHNENRKIKNGFALAIKNLRELAELEKEYPGFTASATISLTRPIALRHGQDRSEAEELIEFLREDVGIQSVGFDHIRSASEDVFMLPPKINSAFAPPPELDHDPKNRHKRNGDVQLDIDEMDEVNERLRRYEQGDADRLTLRRIQTQVEIKRSKKRLIDCMAGVADCVIYPDGGVSACEFTKPFANLREFDYDLRALIASREADVMRKMVSKCACTHPCHLSDSLAYDTDFLKFYLGEGSTQDARLMGRNEIFQT